MRLSWQCWPSIHGAVQFPAWCKILVWRMPVIPVPGRWRQGDRRFKATLDSRSCTGCVADDRSKYTSLELMSARNLPGSWGGTSSIILESLWGSDVRMTTANQAWGWQFYLLRVSMPLKEIYLMQMVVFPACQCVLATLCTVAAPLELELEL